MDARLELASARPVCHGAVRLGFWRQLALAMHANRVNRHGLDGGPQRGDLYRGIMGVVAEPFVLEQSENRQWVIDPPVDDDPHGYVRKARAEVRAAGLMAQTTVTLDADEETDLAEFFGGLARDWKGWEGERRWLALEAEMAVEAWHDGRAHVMIAVTVKRPWLTYAQDAWSARVVFTLEAGEELTAVARDLAFLLRESGRS